MLRVLISSTILNMYDSPLIFIQYNNTPLTLLCTPKSLVARAWVHPYLIMLEILIDALLTI